MKNMNKIVKNAKNGSRSWKSEMNAFLRSYRATPHSSTGVAPADLIFRDANQSKVIKVHHVSNNKYKMLVIQALSKNRQANRTMKKYADEKRKAVKAEFQTGEKVILDQIKNKKIYNKFSMGQHTVQSRRGERLDDHHRRPARPYRNKRRELDKERLTGDSGIDSDSNDHRRSRIERHKSA